MTGAMATIVALHFHKNFIYVIRTLSLIFLWKISFLAQRAHASEILPHFSQLYPTHSRIVYGPTGTILAVSYSEVPQCFLQNINLNRPVVLQGRPTLPITVGQGPTALAGGAGGGCLDIFLLIYPFSSVSPSLWETARYRLKHWLKGPLNPKQPPNQPNYPTQSRLVYDPNGTLLAILYSEVPHMFPAKYQPNPPGGSGKEVVWMVFTIYGHGCHFDFESWPSWPYFI